MILRLFFHVITRQRNKQSVYTSVQNWKTVENSLAEFALPGAAVWLEPGFHYPSWRPELTARVDGWPVSITRQLTRVVLMGARFPTFH